MLCWHIFVYLEVVYCNVFLVKIIDVVFCVFILRPHLSAHLMIDCSRSCSFDLIYEILRPDSHMALSSAYKDVWMLCVFSVGKSFISMMKSRGEITEPWGTPLFNGISFDVVLPSLSVMVLLVKKLDIQL